MAARLPLDVRVGTLLLFHAKQRWVLARHVVVDRALLDLHEQVAVRARPGRLAAHRAGAVGPARDAGPRRHRRRSSRQALAVVAESPPFTARALRLRRWDQQAGEAWDVTARRPRDGRRATSSGTVRGAVVVDPGRLLAGRAPGSRP